MCKAPASPFGVSFETETALWQRVRYLYCACFIQFCFEDVGAGGSLPREDHFTQAGAKDTSWRRMMSVSIFQQHARAGAQRDFARFRLRIRKAQQYSWIGPHSLGEDSGLWRRHASNSQQHFNKVPEGK